jgi:hypothetical protein
VTGSSSPLGIQTLNLNSSLISKSSRRFEQFPSDKPLVPPPGRPAHAIAVSADPRRRVPAAASLGHRPALDHPKGKTRTPQGTTRARPTERRSNLSSRGAQRCESRRSDVVLSFGDGCECITNHVHWPQRVLLRHQVTLSRPIHIVARDLDGRNGMAPVRRLVVDGDGHGRSGQKPHALTSGDASAFVGG